MIKKQVAIIGSGNWAKVIVPKINKAFDIKYFHSKGNVDNISWFHSINPNVKFCHDYVEIQEDKDIKAVFVLTPINYHYHFAKLALMSGKSVFVEKPLTGDFKKSKYITNLADKNNLVLFTGYLYLYNEFLDRVRSSIQEQDEITIDFKWRKYGSFKEEICENLLSHDLSILLGLGLIPQSFDIIKHERDNLSIIATGTNFKAKFNINRRSKTKRKLIEIDATKQIVWKDNTLSIDGKAVDTNSDALENELNEFNRCLSYPSESNNLKYALQIDRILSDIIHTN